MDGHTHPSAKRLDNISLSVPGGFSVYIRKGPDQLIERPVGVHAVRADGRDDTDPWCKVRMIYSPRVNGGK